MARRLLEGLGVCSVCRCWDRREQATAQVQYDELTVPGSARWCVGQSNLCLDKSGVEAAVKGREWRWWNMEVTVGEEGEVWMSVGPRLVLCVAVEGPRSSAVVLP